MMIRWGFGNRWVKLIMRCISVVSYSVVLDGQVGERFFPSRDLRQDDPLSSFLFLLCSEGLSSLMRIFVQDDWLKSARARRNEASILHFLFADYPFLFGENILKTILQEYEQCSGQCINFNKFTVFCNTNRQLVFGLLSVQHSDNPERYLGLPNMVVDTRRRGREVFIKSVLQVIPTYTMVCFLFPKALCNEMEGIMAKFWWQKGPGKRGIHWCSWEHYSESKELGELGFRSLVKFNVALLAIKGWCLINHLDLLLACVLQAKYYLNSSFLNANLGNLPSFTWKSVWSARGLLVSRLCWRTGSSTNIS
ncbi:reverse transcriptase [Gossypium australe]|uniref:Reverse transcriptase n=1 Tax=Gossypium australe TaxID=47621 RepID=A0A5B6WW47_9ROSI|nr:reverse transcriptase [Gossypium australe]